MEPDLVKAFSRNTPAKVGMKLFVLSELRSLGCFIILGGEGSGRFMCLGRSRK